MLEAGGRWFAGCGDRGEGRVGTVRSRISISWDEDIRQRGGNTWDGNDILLASLSLSVEVAVGLQENFPLRIPLWLTLSRGWDHHAGWVR